MEPSAEAQYQPGACWGRDPAPLQGRGLCEGSEHCARPGGPLGPEAPLSLQPGRRAFPTSTAETSALCCGSRGAWKSPFGIYGNSLLTRTRCHKLPFPIHSKALRAAGLLKQSYLLEKMRTVPKHREERKALPLPGRDFFVSAPFGKIGIMLKPCCSAHRQHLPEGRELFRNGCWRLGLGVLCAV